jgi:hypothetical protein
LTSIFTATVRFCNPCHFSASRHTIPNNYVLSQNAIVFKASLHNQLACLFMQRHLQWIFLSRRVD